uniref:Uncharacterized protein n=1 Tax=Cannabis sativa TaxID=3483 RepID=A0A803PCU6_CANSA
MSELSRHEEEESKACEFGLHQQPLWGHFLVTWPEMMTLIGLPDSWLTQTAVELDHGGPLSLMAPIGSHDP